MFILLRSLTYSALFIGLLLIYVPARLVSWTGLQAPAQIHFQQIAGLVFATAGGALALWCILTFARLGRGTPFPLDPPRRLVIRGPYRFVRNPMYIGAGMALAGAALFRGSWALFGYAGAFLLATHFLILAYEEPTLRRSFGQEYEVYCSRVRRWWPRVF